MYRAIAFLSGHAEAPIYDTYGHEGLAGWARSLISTAPIFQDFHDIFGEFFGFEDLFGAGGGRRRARSDRRVQRGAEFAL